MSAYNGRALLEAIWTQAYAAAFVVDFEKFYGISGFDRALEVATAERAETIADAAVKAWIRWNEDGRGEKWKGAPSGSAGKGDAP